MIDRREIIDIAGAQSLLPQVVEKDYVPGWILAGIYQHEVLAKAGTLPTPGPEPLMCGTSHPAGDIRGTISPSVQL